ncbi:PP2C family serine/threonine-protein phosphatase [Pseudonocardia sp. KRD291]|uniref:PP2C family protein-serine/threonine phosphatase n=1 Tax=Pseudonocardia sp. KRD291 TaxID=2792007 RepID=UPI001C4A503B|nr:PP2C family serine/threonine-protein phosphatase [Pseudonocardia sp. KRD291]MBW0105590.1 protein phosphatase 2C domain-containing protein [Pseudonocardia sp. KRD291]
MTDRQRDHGAGLLAEDAPRADTHDACRSCAAPAAGGDRFCPACGTDRRIVRGGTTVVAARGEVTRTCPECGGEGRPAPSMPGRLPGIQWCDTCGARLGESVDRVEVDLGVLAGVSDRGLVHRRNEDAIALGRVVAAGAGDRPEAAVVCDGVSSTNHPEEAARAAADATLDVLLCAPGEMPAAPGLRMRAAVAAGAAAVADLGGGVEGPSCTLVAAHVDDGEITVGWVGDSRAYWLPVHGAGLRLTEDHSWAAEAVAVGLLDAEAAASDRRAHAITRWLGPQDHPEPDVTTLRPDGAGILLLCSDGLWNYLPEPGDLAEIVRTAASTIEAADTLTRAALDAGGRDNISVVVLPVAP